MATNDLAALEARLREVTRKLVVSIEGYAAEVCTEIGAILVPATPVDTGLARGNWLPSLNSPVPVPTSLVDPTGAGAVARIGSVAAQFKAGDTFFLVNRVPYINLLNSGSSRQAPALFVEQSVQAAIDAVSKRRQSRSEA